MTETESPASDDAERLVRRGRGRPKLRPDSEIRLHILDRAFERMLREGYAATRMDDIAGDSGISKRTLYRLFAGKLELLTEMIVLHRQWMMLIPEEPDETPLEEMLGRVLRIDLEPELDTKRRVFLDFAIAAARQNPEVGEVLRREGGDKARRALAEFFAKLAAQGRLAVTDPDRAAGMLMDLAYGAVPLKSGKGGEWPGEGDRRSYLEFCIRFFINGMGKS